MDFLKVEFFDDPGDSGDMLKSARLIFPLVKLMTDGFFLLGGEINFSILCEEV